jgi:hypothetical protein
MKTTLKILGLIFIIAFTMPSCEADKGSMKPEDMNPPFRPEDFYELHHNIRPTKPIRIPDTMRISSAHPKVYNPPHDSTPEIPQDSIPQENEE